MSQLAPWPESHHAEHRAILLSRASLVFVPVPKAGCTSVLWMLAKACSLNPKRFVQSVKPQVSRVMAIHDLDLWPEMNRWNRLTPEQRSKVDSNDDWLRFTVVRDPAQRVWSAWQDKLLMRQPDFVGRYGTTAWFPDPPTSPEQIVADFRAFVRALADDQSDRPVDPHWTPQTTLLANGPELNFIGRTEDMASVLERVGQRVGPEHSRNLERENSGLLKFHPALFDDECRDIINLLYGDDYTEYGFTKMSEPTEDLSNWAAATENLVSAMSQIVDRHRRIGDLQQLAWARAEASEADSPKRD